MANIFNALRAKGVTYEIWLTDDTGTRLDSLTDKVHSLNAVIGGRGNLDMVLKADYPWQKLGFGNPVALDRRVEIWRGANNTRASRVAVFFLRAVERKILAARMVNAISGPGPSDLYHRRIIAYDAGTSEAVKDDLADDMMKETVRENLGGSAVAARDITALDFSIQADANAGPTIKQAMNRDFLQDALEEMAQKARIEGTRVYYAIIPVGDAGFEFQTWINQPGQDLTGGGLVFSVERGNLSNPSYKIDYRNTVNLVYAGGQGEEGARNVREVSSAARIALSLYNRREGWADANDVISGGANENAEIDARGNAVLRAGEPIKTFSTDIIDAPGARFGVDWKWGDRVLIDFVEQFEAVVDRVRIKVGSDGKEQIEAKTEWVA